MKSTLAFDPAAKQFRCDVGKKANGKPKRFYLGTDANAAQERKLILNELWKRCQQQGDESWTAETLAMAESIRTGAPVEIKHRQVLSVRTGPRSEATADMPFSSIGEDEPEHEFNRRVSAMVKRVPKGTPVVSTASADDLATATQSLLLERIAQLETLVRDKLGAGAVVGADVMLHKALDEYHEYRKATEIDPDTQKPKDSVGTEGNNIRLVKRIVADMPSSVETCPTGNPRIQKTIVQVAAKNRVVNGKNTSRWRNRIGVSLPWRECGHR